MKLILALFLSFYFGISAAQANEVADEIKKEDMKEALEQLKESGAFSEAQIELAKKRLKGMDDTQLKDLVRKGQEKAVDPKFQKKVQDLVNKKK